MRKWVRTQVSGCLGGGSPSCQTRCSGGTGHRQPVKTVVTGVAHTSDAKGVSLSTKLDAKRAAVLAEGEACPPFGLPASTAAGSMDRTTSREHFQVTLNGQAVDVHVGESDDEDFGPRGFERIGEASPSSGDLSHRGKAASVEPRVSMELT